MRIFIILFSLLMITGSCVFQKNLRKDTNQLTYRELLAGNESWHHSVKTLQGQARITLDSPQYSGNFNADILVNGPDSLLITITGPMGIRVGKVFITANRFVFYNQVMNQFITGTQKDFEDTNFLQFPLEIGQLRSVFAAQDAFEILKEEKFKRTEDGFYVEALNGDLNFHIWFEPEYLHIKKIEYYDNRQLLFYKEYDRFKVTDGIVFPRSINFVRPEEKQGLTIFFTELHLNQPIDPERFIINISDNAKQIDLSLEQ